MISTTQLRRIAILVDGLDRITADQLLDQFSEDQQRQIRDAVVLLDDVTEGEKQRVSHEFFAAPDGPTSERAVGIQHGNRMLRGRRAAGRSANGCWGSRAGRPLQSVLETASLGRLHQLMCHEHPQTISLVVAALSPSRAAAFLEYWPPAQQAEVLRRVAELNEVDESFVADMQQELTAQLSRENETRRDSAGWQRVRSILSATPRGERNGLLRSLAEQDGGLARALASADSADEVLTDQPVDPNEIGVAFDRFVDLDRDTLVEVFSQLPLEVSALALAGASRPGLVDILARLPAELSRRLQHQLGRLGPLRLRDIHYAQQAAVSLGRRAEAASSGLNRSGRLKLTA